MSEEADAESANSEVVVRTNDGVDFPSIVTADSDIMSPSIQFHPEMSEETDLWISWNVVDIGIIVGVHSFSAMDREMVSMDGSETSGWL